MPPILLLVLAFVAYFNADHEEFFFDDNKDVLVDPGYAPSAGHALRTFWREQLSSDAPLTYLSFALNHAMNRALGHRDADVTGFLAVNIAIHGLNAVLLYWMVRSLLARLAIPADRTVWIALAAAVVFVVHPINASSVAYIIQRRGSLATTFCLLAVLCYLRARAPTPSSPDTRSDARGGAPPVRGRQKRPPADQRTTADVARAASWPASRIALAAAVPICCWLSFRSKNMGLVTPVILLAVEFCLRAARRRIRARHLVWLAAGLSGCIAIMLAFLWQRGLFDPGQAALKSFGEGVTWGAGAHWLTESRVFVHYWKLLLLPLPRWSCIDHGFEVSLSMWDHGALLAVVFHVVLLVVGLAAVVRGHALAGLGILWFYIALIPYALLPQAELMVEYKTYLPAIGVMLILGQVLVLLQHRVAMRWQVPAVIVIAGVLLITTICRNRVYQTTLALWEDAVAKSPEYPRPRYNYADALGRAGRFDEAILQYEAALRLASRLPQVRPLTPQIYNNLGIALLKQRRHTEAIRRFEQALEIEPRYAKVHNNLGSALCEVGRRAEAVEHFREACRLEPDFAQARENLATTLTEMGDEALQREQLDEAVVYYGEAVRVMPALPQAHFGLGNALVRQGSLDEAAGAYREAIRIQPDFAEAHTHLGNVLVLQGHKPQAVASYGEALRHRPDLVAARFGLANLLAEMGELTEAIGQYEEILRLKPDHQPSRVRLNALLGTTSQPPR